MESKFYKDALFFGMGSNSFKLGTILSQGWFWMRTGGCHTIYRGQDGKDIDDENVLGCMSLDDESVNVPDQSFAANTKWGYVRRQLSQCGLESADSEACVVIADGTGDLVGNMPNAPKALTIEQLAGGKFRLRWRYSYLDEDYPPSGFNVYADTGSGFDFDDPAATVVLTGSENSWVSETYTNGQIVKFCVRSFVTGGGESQNTNFVFAVADSVGPPAITDLMSTVEDV